MSLHIGIDFGTTTTLLSVWNADEKRPDLVRLGRSSDTLPSTLHVNDKQQFLFGEGADDLMHQAPEGYVHRVKRELNEQNTLTLFSRQYEAEVLVTAYFHHLFEFISQEYPSGEIASTTLTIPALYGERYIDSLSNAAASAGFQNISIIGEPVAAGLTYLHIHHSECLSDGILVFDWGGGTLDLAVMQPHEGSFRVVPELIGGDAMLGGEDIDDLLCTHFIHHTEGLIDLDHIVAKNRLRATLRQLKHRLSSGQEEVSGPIIFPGRAPVTLTLTQSLLRDLTEPLINKALSASRQLLAKALKMEIPVSHILLVGGSTKLSYLPKSLQNELKLPTLEFSRSAEAVCLGAAFAAHMGLSLPQKASRKILILEEKSKKAVATLEERFMNKEWAVLETLLYKRLRSEGVMIVGDVISSIDQIQLPETKYALLEWIQTAADHGYPYAKRLLASGHELGKLVSRDILEAAVIYNTLLDTDERGFAAWRLGKIHLDTDNGQFDETKGLNYLKKAVELFQPEASLDLAKLLLEINTEADILDAIELLTEISNTSDEALYLLSKEYLKNPDYHDQGVNGLMELVAKGFTDAAWPLVDHMLMRDLHEARRYAEWMAINAKNHPQAPLAKIILLDWESDHQTLYTSFCQIVIDQYKKLIAAGDEAAALTLIRFSRQDVSAGMLSADEVRVIALDGVRNGSVLITCDLAENLILTHSDDDEMISATLNSLSKLPKEAHWVRRDSLIAVLRVMHEQSIDAHAMLRRGLEAREPLTIAFQAILYIKGVYNCRKDDTRGRQLLEDAIKQDEPLAIHFHKELITDDSDDLYQEGLKLIEGINASSDKNQNFKAFECFQKAAELNHADAQYICGTIYKVGTVTKQSNDTAFIWFTKAALQGHAYAQYECGLCYYEGRGIKQSGDDAFCFFQKSADQGNPDAQYYLGICCAKGVGVEQSNDTAYKWLRKAALQGLAKAQYECGRLYYELNYKISENEAKDWLNKAILQGHIEALILMSKESLQSLDKSIRKQGFSVISTYAEQGNIQAQLACAYAHKNGLGVWWRSAKKAFIWTHKAACQKDAEAQYLCGLCFRDGEGAHQSKEEAYAWFLEAAKQGHVEAQYLRGLCFRDGEGTWKSKNEAHAWFLKAAKQGHAGAQYLCGVSFWHGEGTHQSKEEAYAWFLKAAKQGHAHAHAWFLEAAKQGHVEAQYLCGLCFRDGEGTHQSKEEAHAWFLEAAKQGHVEAQYLCGLSFRDGERTKKSKEEAYAWFLKAAVQGHVEAQYLCGLSFRDGEGTHQSKKEAHAWFLKAALQGHVEAQYLCGLCFRNGEGTHQLKKQAHAWFLKAAKQRHVEAQYLCGLCFRDGEGAHQSKEEAYAWFLEAAKQEHVEAQYLCGLCFRDGEGTRKSKENAHAWFLKAALQGHVEAQYLCGLCFQNGEGTKKSKEEAHAWFLKAAVQGHVEAQYLCGLSFRDGEGTHQSKKEAHAWFLKAALQGHVEAQYLCGLCFRDGEGTKKSKEEAHAWFLKAAEQGHSEAEQALEKLREKQENSMLSKVISAIFK